MNRPQRSIEIFTMSALDLFVTAMGSFAILMMILFPYYHKKEPAKQSKAVTDALNQSRLLFCVWTTRIQDYEAFVKETHYTGTTEQAREKKNGEKSPPEKALWRNPGYDQEPEYPVVNVSLADARAFCEWLTKKEREAHLIGPQDVYRLPTDAEWMAASGQRDVPWPESKEPIPARAGNYGGKEYDEVVGGQGLLGKANYRDAYEMVAPVGKFLPNDYGLFDMGGNVQQWCDEIYRAALNRPDDFKIFPRLKDEKNSDGSPLYVVHGGSWQTRGGPALRTTFRDDAPDSAWDDVGFRCVLVLKPAGP